MRSSCGPALRPGAHSASRFLIQAELIADGIREHGERAHPGPDVSPRRQDSTTSGLNPLQGVRNDIYHDVGARWFVWGPIALLHPGAAHAGRVIEVERDIPPAPDLPAEEAAIQVGGRLGRR